MDGIVKVPGGLDRCAIDLDDSVMPPERVDIRLLRAVLGEEATALKGLDGCMV